MKENIPSIKLVRPEATYVPFLDCRGLGLSNGALFDLLINKARVAMNNGAWFGKGGEGFMRINIATPGPHKGRTGPHRQSLGRIEK